MIQKAATESRQARFRSGPDVSCEMLPFMDLEGLPLTQYIAAVSGKPLQAFFIEEVRRAGARSLATGTMLRAMDGSLRIEQRLPPSVHVADVFTVRDRRVRRIDLETNRVVFDYDRADFFDPQYDSFLSDDVWHIYDSDRTLIETEEYTIVAGVQCRRTIVNSTDPPYDECGEIWWSDALNLILVERHFRSSDHVIRFEITEVLEHEPSPNLFQ